SRMGAQTTYFNKRGNTWDISSLLITLLRISDIPARYVFYDKYDKNNEYVYVEAWVPFDNYRGNGDGSGKDWVPLVPWNKEASYEEGINLFPDTGIIPPDLDFDFDSYLDSVNYKSPLELFEEKVQAYLHTNNQGKTIKDIPFTETTATGSAPFSSLLPGSRPLSLNTNTSNYTTFSEVPYNERINITLKFKHATDDTLLLERTIYLPQIAGKRFCLDFIPADQNSADAIASYGGMCKTPLSANAYVKPVLKIDGVIMPPVTIDGVNVPEAIGSQILLGEQFYVEYTGGVYTNKKRPAREAGTFMQMALDPLSASQQTIERMKMELEPLSIDLAYADDTREEYLGRTGSILTETFLLRKYNNSSRIEDLLYGKMNFGIFPTFIYTFSEEIIKDKESKFYIHPQWNIDASSPFGFTKRHDDGTREFLEWTNPLNVLSRRLFMYCASYNEGRIFEDWMDTQSLNTVKGLMVANEAGIEVREFTNTAGDINDLNNLKYRENFDWGTLSTSQWDSFLQQVAVEQGWSWPLSSNNYNTAKNNFTNGTYGIEGVDHILVDMNLIPEDSLEDQTINFILDEIAHNSKVTAPTKLLDYEGMIGYVMLIEGVNYGGYLFNMDNGGMASEYVEYNPVYVPASNYTVPSYLNDYWSVDYSINVGGAGGTKTTTQDKPNTVNYNPVHVSDGDPVDMIKGEYYQKENPDIIIASRGLPLSVVRTYKSQLIYNGPFGFGWTWNHAERIVPLENGNLLYYNNDGISFELNYQNGTYEYPPGSMFTVEKIVAGTTTYEVTQKRSGHIYYFNEDGNLFKKEDRFGNVLKFFYNNPGFPNRITEIRDTLDRVLTLAYNANGKVDTVTDFVGRFCSYTYTGDDLTTFTDLEQNDTQYQYLSNQENELNDHNMSKYILPNGDYLELGYYKNDTVAWHRNKEGATFNFMYSRLNRYAETWNEEGYYRKIFFNENHDLTRIAHRDGTIEQREYDLHHNMTKLIDGNGNTTTFTFSPVGQPEKAADRNIYSKTNTELGETWSYKYDSPNNSYAPSEVIDPMGIVTQYVYNADGSLHEKTEAPDFAYVDGMLVSSPGAPGFTTTYSYENGNITNINDPLNQDTVINYDANGLYITDSIDKNDYSTVYEYYDSGTVMPVGALKTTKIITPTDATGITTTYEYNHYKQKTKITDDLGNTTILNYDVNRKLETRVLPDGSTTTYSYYPARDIVSGALVEQEIDNLGNSVKFKYDMTGNVISREDKNGNTTTYRYDGMSRLIEEVDPFQNSAKLSYDGNGNVVQQIDKNGNVTMFGYDAANRLVTKTDPEGNVFQYEYYADGKLKNETYTVNATLTTTHYDYNALGHPETKTLGYGSGNTRVFQYRYDALGRLEKTIYPEGNYEEIEYDNNGNTRYTRSFDSAGVQMKKVEYLYYADSRNLLE
ncbi:MAG: hypothetical protein GY941_07935, partial [Planctomycetes bacterium]|nr:hypothetical protein [Planctomycetota bacterium]